MPGGEPPLTDAARAELAAVATDEALEAARHARLAEQALAPAASAGARR